MGKYSKQHWTWWKGEQKAKMGFNTLQEALEWKRINHRPDDDVQPYVCPVCLQWHLGHYKES